MPGDHGQIIESPFRPAAWLRNRHAQTIYPALPWAWRGQLRLRREVVELPDGDATTVDWAEHGGIDDTAPLLVLLHGLESSSASPYARMMLRAAVDRGFEACVLHFRDCGDYRNRLERRYHAGETADLRYFLEQQSRHGRPIVAVGYSLGGNVLLKYLGECGDRTPLSAGAAVCVPLDLQICATSINRGFSKLYQKYMIDAMKRSLAGKFTPETQAFDWQRAMAAVTFDDFDDAVTAPLHGFAGKDDYYAKCSSIRFLNKIRKPTLILNSADDPFMSPEMLPGEDALAPPVTLEISAAGGHVGYIEGGTPWSPRYYVPGRVLEFFGAVAEA